MATASCSRGLACRCPVRIRSRFAAIASGHPGVDPYTMAVSDVYQDLYGEGSFTGKGIYDVDAFQLATHGRFPENTLLSHDLIEGNYARAGLAHRCRSSTTTIRPRYIGHTRRKHRWIRGDWQLLPWLRRRVPGPDGLEPNRLSLVSRWKIFDNLRRSTVETVAAAAADRRVDHPSRARRFAGRCRPPGHRRALGRSRWRATLLSPPLDKSWRAYYAAVARDASVSAQQALLARHVPAAPGLDLGRRDRAHRSRLLVSHRLLLEWQFRPAGRTARVEPARRETLAMPCGPAWLLGDRARDRGRDGTACGRNWRPANPLTGLLATGVAMGSLILPWLLAPLLASRLSQPSPSIRHAVVRRAPGRRPSATRSRHWAFFDRFVTAETHWLAPDNFQEDPEPVVAMRTSPTNIGLQLLSTVSAQRSRASSPWAI